MKNLSFHRIACSALVLLNMFMLAGCHAKPVPSFTDHVTYPTQQVAFEMVLIPGSADGSIKPFYIGKTEVTWHMFRGWSYGADLLSQDEVGRELSRGLRPSALYADRPNARMGFDDRPAVGMTYKTAQLYCDWLSKQTGRTYRLPTDAEWSRVLKLSGGIPNDRAQLLQHAVLQDNAPVDELRLESFSAPVASKKPNALGLFDLIGNAAEWVQADAGEQPFVRGGHFQLNADQLTTDWRSTQDFDLWNASSPQLPTQASWYIDHYYQGIRLVCEVPIKK